MPVFQLLHENPGHITGCKKDSRQLFCWYQSYINCKYLIIDVPSLTICQIRLQSGFITHGSIDSIEHSDQPRLNHITEVVNIGVVAIRVPCPRSPLRRYTTDHIEAVSFQIANYAISVWWIIDMICVINSNTPNTYDRLSILTSIRSWGEKIDTVLEIIDKIGIKLSRKIGPA